MELSETARKFVLHWGEMGARWGVNRTVAQVHALLYLSPEPLDAEAITNTLGVARSNVSTSLRELQAWGIVRPVHVLGNRREHYQTLGDVWEMFQVILDERKKREIDPTLALLEQLVEESKAGDAFEHSRLTELRELLSTVSRWYTQIRSMPQGAVIKFVKMGRKITKLLGASA